MRRTDTEYARYYGKKVIILLDEYDTSMQEAVWNLLLASHDRLGTFQASYHIKKERHLISQHDAPLFKIWFLNICIIIAAVHGSYGSVTVPAVDQNKFFDSIYYI